MTARIPGVIQWGDFPVPYVAAWSSESVPMVRMDKLLYPSMAIFRNGRRGLGRPMFGRMDESRARQVVLQRLCQVCARPLRSRPFVCDVPYARAEGRYPLLKEPASCERCFYIALGLCPGIARMLEDPKVVVGIVRAYAPVAVTLGPVEGGDPVLNQLMERHAREGTQVIGYVRAAIIEYDALDPAVLLRMATTHTSKETHGDD